MKVIVKKLGIFIRLIMNLNKDWLWNTKEETFLFLKKVVLLTVVELKKISTPQKGYVSWAINVENNLKVVFYLKKAILNNIVICYYYIFDIVIIIVTKLI